MKAMIEITKKIYRVMDRRQRGLLLVLFVMIFLESALELLGVSSILPLVNAITDPDSVLDGSSVNAMKVFSMITGSSDIRFYVVMLALTFALIYLAKNIFLILMKRFQLGYINRTQKDISNKLFESYIAQDYLFHVDINVADLQRNVTGDVTNFFTLLQNYLDMVAEVLVCIVLTVYLAITDIQTTATMAVLMGGLLLVYTAVLKKKLRLLGSRSRDLIALKGKWFLQTFYGIKEIKAGNREDYFRDKYEDLYAESVEVVILQALLNFLPKPLFEIVCISGIMCYMAVRIYMGADMNGFIPILSVFAVSAFRMLPSMNRISGNLNQIIFNKPSLDALYRDLQEVESLPMSYSRSHSSGKLALKNGIEVNDLCFSYPSKPDKVIFKNVSFDIPARKSVALVGSSGAGKTTLADIILGLYAPGQGTIRVDGSDINSHPEEWHRSIGYIPQTIYLTDDTIRANVAFGINDDDIDDDKVWSVLESASLSDFVREQKDGLDTMIGDRGVKLSGGQRQRIGIARALYTDPELLVLDEATSALDNDTEGAVMDAIYHLAGKVTMLVIAHRITTIRNCDIIYRVENGTVSRISYEEALKGNE